ncbi:MAG TPA: hypothetical protein VFC19_14025 [Candidatus Limnocylindrales bacterium]|nr:hypothetical protein [Candidatus Limnocylindrales bacterium]
MRTQAFPLRAAGVAVLALVGAMLPAASPAAAASVSVAGPVLERAVTPLALDTFMTPLLDALRPHAQAVGLGDMLDGSEPTRHNWRSRLDPLFDEIPALLGAQTAGATLSGVVVTGALHLPAVVTLTGETTIVARTVVSTTGPVKIIAAGYPIHLYPIDGVFLGGPDPTLIIDSATVPPPESNPNGQDGTSGESGISGDSGEPGEDGWGDNCDGTSGGYGEPGWDGTSGEPGGDGQPGGSAGRIDVDIPLDDLSRYQLMANGGDGGSGGHGGSGGNGGSGGSGGNGGNADIDYAWYCVGGDGGNGADGGDGGNAANGGNGGNGGNGADITVASLAGDTSSVSAVRINDPLVQTSARAGNGGARGNAGSFGYGGSGGSGGRGGFGTFHDGNDGWEGWDGFDGNSANDGNDGTTGDPGLIMVQQRCLDTRVRGNVEERRLTKKVGTQREPAASQILRTSNFVPSVTAFETALCGSANVAAAETAITNAGTSLWTTATQRAQPGGGDDRPLYWARLSMSLTLRQWRPPFPVDQATRDRLLKLLEETSRGITSIAFATPPGAKRLLVTGFDPFALGADVRRSNPSGAAALALDGTTRMVGTTPVVVQAIIFPVRYADFNAGIVENALRPFLAPSAVDAVTTTSQGSAGTFHLEVWNGRRRSDDPFKDNLDSLSGGTDSSPVVAPGMGPGAEFISHSLPHSRMIAAANGQPDPVVSRPSVIEIPAGGGGAVFRPNGPTAGSIAVDGGGGGFLSNEVAYRATRLRLELNSTTPTGHVHVAAMPLPTGSAITDPAFEARRAAIVAQTILVVPPAAVP